MIKEYIDRIIDIEWEMFDKVQNEGGRAGCQDDFRTFSIMRGSQYEAWSDELVSSYLMDLEKAREEGINMLSLKYAYMMEITDPVGYEGLKGIIPPVSPEKRELIDRIMAQHIKWSLELHREYPYVAGRGRPVSQEGSVITSISTYLYGECATYSEVTLGVYLDYIDRLVSEGRNLAAETMEKTAIMSGYSSLEEAEAILSGGVS